MDRGDGHDDTTVNCDLDIPTIHILSNAKTLVAFVVVAMVTFELLTTLQKLCLDLLLFRMKLKRESLKIRNLHGATKSQNEMLARSISKFVTVPVYLLGIYAVARAIFWVFVVVA
jgi:hypothetical protein